MNNVTPQPKGGDLFRQHSAKAEIIHSFAENLAQTLGVFLGINDTATKLAIDGDSSIALNTILFDQLQIMVIRVCALCGNGARDDDASLGQLVDALADQDFQQFLINRENKWVDALGYRANAAGKTSIAIETLKSSWTALDDEADALKRIRHYRNKVLAHATTGLDPDKKILVGDIWRISRLVLKVAESIRLLMTHEKWSYLEHSEDGKANGEALILALHRDSKTQAG